MQKKVKTVVDHKSYKVIPNNYQIINTMLLVEIFFLQIACFKDYDFYS